MKSKKLFISIFLCLSLFVSMVSASILGVDSCTNVIQDGNETGIDCGGECEACSVPDNDRILYIHNVMNPSYDFLVAEGYDIDFSIGVGQEVFDYEVVILSNYDAINHPEWRDVLENYITAGGVIWTTGAVPPRLCQSLNSNCIETWFGASGYSGNTEDYVLVSDDSILTSTDIGDIYWQEDSTPCHCGAAYHLYGQNAGVLNILMSSTSASITDVVKSRGFVYHYMDGLSIWTSTLLSGTHEYFNDSSVSENVIRDLLTYAGIPLPATCSDGIQNGDEEGIDCGGSCPACSCEQQILFSDDFSGDLSQWKIWGSPLPYIDSNKGSPAPSLQNNGDASYQSGMHSHQTFDYSNGLVMEWDVQQDTLGQIFKGGFVGISKTFDGHSTGGGWRWIGVDWNAADGIFSLIAGDEVISAYTLSTTDWHHIKVVIRSDLFVEVYVNDILRATTSNPVSLEFNNYPLETEGRQVWFDNIIVRNYCGSTCTDGIQNGDEEGIDCGGSCPNACTCIEIILFEDNFEDNDVSDWIVTEGSWNVINGILSSYETAYIMAPYEPSGNYKISGQFNIGDNSWDKEADIIFKTLTQEGFRNGQYHQIQNRVDTGEVYPVRYDDVKGVLAWRTEIGTIYYPFEPNNWYNFELIVQGMNVDYYIEGEHMFSITMHDAEEEFWNKFGFKTYPNTRSYFDNIVVTNYCASSCTDGIQNGDEEGIDCGGSCPDACECIPQLLYADNFDDNDISDWDVKVGSFYTKDGSLAGSGTSYIQAPISFTEPYVATWRVNMQDYTHSWKEANVLINIDYINGHDNCRMCQITSQLNGEIRVWCYHSYSKTYTEPELINSFEVTNFDFQPNTWYDLKIIVDGHRMKYYINNMEILELWMENVTLGTGFGFKVYPSGESLFDDLEIFSYCGSEDVDEDGYTADVDCNDNNPAIHPGAEELCDGIDNNCDNIIDDITQPCGSGICEGTRVCTDGIWSDCSSSGTDAGVCSICGSDGNIIYDGTQDGDCAYNNLAEVNICTYDPDNNPFTIDYASAFLSQCIGISECSVGVYEFTHTCSFDTCSAECDSSNECSDTGCQDMDGCYEGTYRDYNDVSNVCLDDCICTNNWCEDYSEIITDMDNDGHDIECDADCDDNDATIYLDAPELCDGKDNDCDGFVDEGYPDYDGDGIADCVDEDDDNDGVIDNDDLCGLTPLPETNEGLVPNNFADVDGDGLFETNTGSNSNPIIEDSAYTLVDTYGCSCEQILFCKPGENKGEVKHGCSQGTMDIFIQKTAWSTECFSDGVFLEGESKSLLENTDESGVIDLMDTDNDNDGISDGSEINEGRQVDDAQEDGKPDWWCVKHPDKC